MFDLTPHELLDLVNTAKRILLGMWRESGEQDHEILRTKLIGCGWKYYRRRGGGWYHPKVLDYPAPQTLDDLAGIIGTQAVKDTLAKKKEGSA